jgi:hypothetical protein
MEKNISRYVLAAIMFCIAFTVQAQVPAATDKAIFEKANGSGGNAYNYGDIKADIQSGLAGGTVTSVSVATANGFTGTVATATTTPAITIGTNQSGILKGNGTGISPSCCRYRLCHTIGER